MKKGLVFLGMGFELLGLILGGLYLGQTIDKVMNWPGYGVAGVVICCLVSWLIHLIFMLKKFMNEAENDPAD
jgi:hypothetical protein